MSQTEKIQLLNERIELLGYQYLPCEDIFFTTFDAWQRELGYTHRYDCLAPYFNMVFDSEPVYFDYDNRTWLVEFWKGQYGINTGAEIGIYCADKIIPPDKRSRELFHTISDEELPLFSMTLIRNENQIKQDLATLSMQHWWLAAFRMGCFSQPDNLEADLSITFSDCGMMHAFANALIRIGYAPCSLNICGCRICFSYGTPKTAIHCGFPARAIRCLVQWKNRLFCRLYLIVTRPFCCTVDRLIYLYFYLPYSFRCCLHLRRCKCFQKKKKNIKKCCGFQSKDRKHRGGEG